ncbi:2-dehydropantoate 2-reductase [Spongiibacter sp. KMU-158]|uniref:2-dehydropantoate 2-reductase n=1 Tax=Spongiibacter pelagi TaxID=2760804 RepID=A0A927C3A3_9GAMM|nr:2-dehydropantoate 2-reductase [Spongiibacter pelagi]MBD2858685.1 2-dehydropantoate 2-reductase [Spongiibacter pelagi]
MTKSDANWHILGAGAIGSLWASYAYKAGRAMPLILKDNESLKQYQTQGGLLFESAAGGAEMLPLPVCIAAQLNQSISHLLVCTKAQHTEAAITAIADKIEDDAYIVLLQNGLGVAEKLRQQFPKARLLQASTTEGAFRKDRFHIVHAGRGETFFGPHRSTQDLSPDEITQLASALSPAPLQVTATENIEKILWRKLAVNCAINPLTVKYRCRNGELLDNPAALQEMATLVDEIVLLSKALGRESWVEKLLEQVHQVAANTALNRSSMLQDIEAGRDTEISFITGYLLKKASSIGIELTVNESLFHQFDK